jgi:choline-sulfatase
MGTEKTIGTGRLVFAAATLLVVFAAAAWLLRIFVFPADPSGRGWNVLLITLDTTRADSLGCYGHPTIRTPRIDAFAAEGALFEQCVTTAPITLPAHASILTGTDPYVHGVRTNGQVMADAGNATLAEILSDIGYVTGARVAAFVLHSRFGISQGFESYEDVERVSHAPVREQQEKGRTDALSATIALVQQYPERRADAIADSTIAWLEERSAEGGETPFFLWTHFFDPHEPWTPPARLRNRFGSPYLGEIAFVDEQVGRVLDTLEHLGLDGKTLVVIVGDHGEGLGDHGEETHTCFLYDTTVRVPLIIRAPGLLSRGKRIPEQVRVTDITPTILDLLGCPPLEGVQGVSLLSLVNGQAGDGLVAYSETMIPRYDFELSHLRSLRKAGWKYIHAPGPELYEVSVDGREAHNVAADHPDRVAAMRAALRGILENAPPPASDGGSDGPATSLDQADRERLMALGYLGGGGDCKGGELSFFVPEGEDPKDRLRELSLVANGLVAMRDEHPEEALRLLREAMGLYPRWWIPIDLAATVLARNGRAAEAVTLVAGFVTAEPERADARLRLGLLHGEAGAREEARECLTESLRLDPNLIEARKWLARDAAKGGRHGEAVGQMREILRQIPDNVAFLSLLSWTLATCPDGSIRSGGEARLLAEKACRLSGDNNPLALFSLAAACAEEGRFVEAVEHASLAVRRAAAQGKNGLASRIDGIRRDYYTKGVPFHEKKR